MEVSIEIEKSGEDTFYFICKIIPGGILWMNKKKQLVRHKGERACVRRWEHAVKLMEKILSGEIS